MTVTVGSQYCTVDSNGCATDGEGDHGDDERCTIEVNQAGTLTATEFDVESHSACSYDAIYIGSSSYCGGAGPSTVVVAAGSTFTWLSDHAITNAGWTICFAPFMEVTVGSQHCTVDAACATDGDGDHGNEEACTIQVNQAGTLTATRFDTQSGIDNVAIGGVE